MTTALLIGVAAVLLIAVVVLLVLLRRARSELAELQASLRVAPKQGPVAATERVVRAVVSSAARLRDTGLAGLLSASFDDLVQWAREDRAEIVRVAAADGTVTFFFSDIENSTALNESLGDKDWARTLQVHNALVRRCIESRSGHVVKTIGDGFMAAFGQPFDAVTAAQQIHRELAGPSRRRLRRIRLRVRIGIHTGTAVSSSGDYIGRNVALAARVAAHAAGGSTLITGAVRDALGPDEFRLESCGSVQLKGISGDTDIWIVC